MRPGITSIGIRKEIQETITNNPRKTLFSRTAKTKKIKVAYQMEDSRLLCKLRRIGSTPFQSQKLKSFHMPPGPEIDVQAVAVLCLKVKRSCWDLLFRMWHALSDSFCTYSECNWHWGFLQRFHLRIKFLCFQMLTESLTFSSSERKFSYQSEEGLRAGDDAKKSIFIGTFTSTKAI